MGLETLLFLVITGVFGMYMAWNIGANDVANAMGTSVGSGALTLKRAVIVAAVLEFSGAFFVGGHVTDTVRKGMLDIEMINDPRALMFGMLAALLASGIWLHIATYKGWPVSTTHSIVGAIVGVGLVLAGVEAIQWDKVLSIMSSWVISPILSGIVAMIFFTIIRKSIFESSNPMRVLKRLAPFLVFIVFNVLVLITTFKGLKNLHLDLTLGQAIIISSGIAWVAASIGWLIIRRVIRKAQADLLAVEEVGILEKKDLPLEDQMVDISQAVTEKVFKYLQILSACAVAFAHGANDVANAVGPAASVWEIAMSLKDGAMDVISKKVPVHPAFLAIGGMGIVLGLATYGWKIIDTIGKKITDLTPTRGFCAEFGAALTILVASRMGLPVSTTHCLVGAVIGVGFARGISSLNMRLVTSILLSWLMTLPVAAIIAILCYYGLQAIF